jgi:hypothetical protein
MPLLILHVLGLNLDYFDIIHIKPSALAFFYQLFWSTLDYTKWTVVYYCMPSLKKKNSVYIGSKIPQNQKIVLENAIDNGDYLNISGFVRDAVKEKLTREGLLLSVKSVAVSS